MKNKFDKYDWMVMALFALLSALIIFLMLSCCPAQKIEQNEVYQAQQGALYEQVNDSTWRKVR